MSVPGRQVFERQRDRGRGAQVGQVAVILEQHVGDAGLGVEQQEQAIAGGEAAVAVLVEAGGELQDDVAPARHPGGFDVYFGGNLGKLEDERVGELGRPLAQGPEPALDRRHGDGERHLVPERLEGDDPHRQSPSRRFRPRSVSASAACSSDSSLP